MSAKKRILVAPLNWGLGHATRCIPIINALCDQGYEPVIASDCIALELLKKEFPDLITLELPGYGITYAKKGKWFRLKILQDAPKIASAIKNEKKETKRIISEYNIKGIISDNRLGVYSKKVPCVFMTHQLNVLSGSTTWISTKLHQKFIQKFTECWVPDNPGIPNLTGKLGHVNTFNIPLKYLGPISRFEKKSLEPRYDIIVLISGPEPQRSYLEKKLLDAFKGTTKNILFVKGIIEKEQRIENNGNLSIYNFMTNKELETALNESEMVLSRSGYTSVMDLAKLEKKAFFIPTPGQFEQEYLAKILDKQKLVPSCKQEEFVLDKLKSVEDYKGLSELSNEVNYRKLFHLFKGE